MASHTAKVDVRIYNISLRVHVLRSRYRRIYMYIYMCVYATHIGTRIEMEWDFSSIYSSCERMPTHIRCYLPFVSSRLTAVRAIAPQRAGYGREKRGGLTGRLPPECIYGMLQRCIRDKICPIERNRRWERIDVSVNCRLKYCFIGL